MTSTTLKKISEVLGISISTVSRALKNHPDISEKTKQKVTELAKALDYEPNANAIHLRTKDSKLFGIIVPSISNFFYDSFIAAVEEESRKSGYSVIILQSSDDPDIELNNIRLCRQSRVSGLFACITPNTKDIQPFLKLAEMETPIIFFDKVPTYEAVNKVCVADTAAATIAAEAIIEKKKKKVLAIFGNKNLSITKRRLEAFSKTFKDKGSKTNLVISYAYSADEAREVVLTNCKSARYRPDTVFCMSDEILTGAMTAIQQLELKIPTEIGVIAISNGSITKLYYPEITYAETSGYKLGKLAFSRMMACINGSTFIQELAVESVLVKGGSL